MTFQPAKHPPSCRACSGTGYMDAPRTPYRAGGARGEYTWQTPCTHDWRDDDPNTDEYGLDRVTPVPPPWLELGITPTEWLARRHAGA